MMVFLGLGGFCFGSGLLSSSLGLDGSSYLLDLLKLFWVGFSFGFGL
jgi:hypothetical protein